MLKFNPKQLKQQMHPECAVAVLIPIYNETLETLLFPLASLIRQKIDFEKFEVVCVVNNSRREAEEKTTAFIQNQRTIKFLEFLQNKKKTFNFQGTKKQEQIIHQMKNSKLRLHILDRSSKNSAGVVNNVGAARDFGGMEICQRFITTKVKGNGIIGMFDCDCRVSENYVEELIKTFQDIKVNGVAGKWLIKIDKDLRHQKLMEKALESHLGKNLLESHFLTHRQNEPVKYQKRDKMKKNVLINGQNMAVRVSSFLNAGGIMHLNSFEDLIFGAKVTDLPGDAAYNPNFYITTLARASARVGMTGFGRRVNLIEQAVVDFNLGKQAHIFVPEIVNMFKFFVKIFHAHSQGKLNSKVLKHYLLQHGANEEGLVKKEVDLLLDLARNEFNQNINHENFYAEGLLEKLCHRLPKQKVMFTI